MDERAIKRLLMIFVISLIVIFVVKKVVSGMIVDLNRIVAEKKQSAAKLPTAQQLTPTTSDAAITSAIPPIPTVGNIAPPELQPVSDAGVSN